MVVDASSSSKDSSWKLLRHRNPRRAHQVTLRSENHAIIVDATDREPTPLDPFRYLLAIVDEDEEAGTGEPVLFDAHLLHVIRRVRSLGSSSEAVESEAKSLSYFQSRNLLGETFGTKRARQAISSLSKNQIDVEAVKESSAHFLQSGAIIATPPESRPGSPLEEEGDGQVQSLSLEALLLPPNNPSATDPRLVFPVDQLLPTDVSAVLPLDDFEADFKANVTFLVPVAARRINLARGKPVEMRLALFLHFLLTFRDLRTGESAVNNAALLKKVCNGCHDDAPMLAFLLDNFTEQVAAVAGSTDYTATRRSFTLVCRDRLTLWILATCLHLESPPKLLRTLECNATQLAADLNLGPIKIASYFKVLGCLLTSPSKDSAHKVSVAGKLVPVRTAQLQMPPRLNPPPQTNNKRRRPGSK